MFNKAKCNNCGETNTKGNKFCSNCGNILSQAICNACGAEISSNMKFCLNCGSKLSQLDNSRRSNESIVSDNQEKVRSWSRNPLDFAKKIEIDDIKGTFNKRITIEQGTKALFLQGGRFNGELLPGTYNVGGLIQKIENLNISEKATVILVDDSDVRINVNVSGLRTSENLEAGIKSTIVLSLEEAILFFNNVMKGRSNVTVTDIEDFLKNEISNVLQSKLKSYSFDTLYGNEDLKNEIQQDLQFKLQTTLERTGLRLIHLPYFGFDETAWSEINEQKRKIGKESAEVKLRDSSEDLEDKRFEFTKRIRERLTLDKINELENSDNFVKFIHEQDKDKVIREDEMVILKQIFEESRDDQRRARNRIIENLEQEHRHKLESEKTGHDIDIQSRLKKHEIDKKKADDEFNDGRHLKDLELKRKKGEEGIDLYRQMQAAKLEKTAGFQNLEVEKLKSDADIEAQKLQNRSNASDEALLSTLDGPQLGQLSELAKMKAAKGLSEEQLMALSAKDSAGVAEAMKAKYSADATKKMYEERMDDQKKFLDKMEGLSDKSADRAERMSMKSMEQMGQTASTRASMPSNTTVVSGEGGQPVVIGGQSGGQQSQKEIEKIVVCRECNHELPLGTKFCSNCGETIN